MIFQFMGKSFAAVALVTAAAVAANARLQGEESLLSQERNLNDVSQHENVFVPRKMEPSMVQSADDVLDNTDRSLKNSNSNEIQNENDLSVGDADEADLGLLNNDRKLQEVFDCNTCAERYLIDDDDYIYDLVDACLVYGYSSEDCPGLIKCWDTSDVTDMTYAVYNQTYFNEPLNCWDTSSVKTMYDMFGFAEEFDQDLSTFNTDKVTNMAYMFYNAKTFNQDISGWKTSKVKDMQGMFYLAPEFDQPIGEWDVAKVTRIGAMFDRAYKFNSNINKWDTSSVAYFNSVFEMATSFNQKLGGWNTSAGTTMGYMFYEAKAFDKPIGAWDVSQVTNMTLMFDSTYFDQPIDEWKPAEVQDMYGMFAESDFNQPIDSWDVNMVARFDYMFVGAKTFNQCLDSWPDKASTPTVLSMFTNSSCPIQTDPDPEAAPWCSDTCGGVDPSICDDSEEKFKLEPGKKTYCKNIAGSKKKKKKKLCAKKAAKKNCPGTCEAFCAIPKYCKDDPDFECPQKNLNKCSKNKVFKNCRLTCDPKCVPLILQQ